MLGDSIRRRRPVRRQGRPRQARPRTAGGARFPWLPWLGGAALVLVASFLAGYLLATRVVFPPPETAGAGVPVPDLYGMDRIAAERAVQELGLNVGAVTEVASARTAAGLVVAQEPVPQQQLRPGAFVSLVVSAGPPSVRIPPVAGLGSANARRLLEAAGFEVQVQPVRARGARDAVLRTEPDAGVEVRLPAVITMHVIAEPEPEPEPEDVEPWPETEPGPGAPPAQGADEPGWR